MYNDLVPKKIIVIKKKVIVLGVLSAALALATATFAVVNINKQATRLDVNYNDNVSRQTGLYIKVTDENYDPDDVLGFEVPEDPDDPKG